MVKIERSFPAPVLRKLKALLKRKSAFAAFKRCYVREHISDYPELKLYLQ